MNSTELILIFNIVGISAAGFLAITLLWGWRKPYVFLGLVFGIMAFQLAGEYLWLSKKIYEFPWFVDLDDATSFLISPLLYFFFVYQKKQFSKKEILLHLLLGLVVFLNKTPLYFQTLEFKNCYVYEEIHDVASPECQHWFDDDAGQFLMGDIFDFLLVFQFAFYAFLIFKNTSLMSENRSKKTLAGFKNWGKLLTGLVILAVLFVLLDNFWSTGKDDYFSVLYLSFISIVVLLFMLKNSIFLENNFRSEVYQNVKQSEIESLWLRANDLLRANDFFTNENLTIRVLAKKMEVSSNLLSHVFTKTKTSFNVLLNDIRIEKAVEILSSEAAQNYSIDGIGRQVGYKSKATFYKHFKDRKGKTPKEFMDSLG